jgi:hypothetical protein
MMKRIDAFSSHEKMTWIQAIGAAIGLIVASFFLPGGDDLYRYYIPFENGCLECGFVPYFAQWFLFPLRLLPDYPLAWPVWTFLSVVTFLALAYFTGINPFLFLISFPFLGQVWLGQIDVLICAGMVLFLFARNPYWRGLGIILALTKPQLTFLPLIFAMLLESPKSIWKILGFPFLTITLSLVIYGFSWPVAWISNSLRGVPEHVWRLAGMDVWKFGIFLLPAPLLLKDQRKRFVAGLLVSALATPFFGVYSYVAFLLMDVRGRYVALSYAWLLGFFWFQESAMRFAWILPVSMLVWLVFEDRKKRQADELAEPMASA